VQMAVGPVEDGLQDAVQLIQAQGGWQYQMAPDLRFRTNQFHADGHAERFFRPAPTAALRQRLHLRPGPGSGQVEELRGGATQLVQVHPGDRFGDLGREVGRLLGAAARHLRTVRLHPATVASCQR